MLGQYAFPHQPPSSHMQAVLCCGLLFQFINQSGPALLCLYMLQILNVNKGGITTVSNWVGVFVVLLALIMSEGAVDSLQNGLAASISGHFLKNSPLSYTRYVVH